MTVRSWGTPEASYAVFDVEEDPFYRGGEWDYANFAQWKSGFASAEAFAVTRVTPTGGASRARKVVSKINAHREIHSAIDVSSFNGYFFAMKNGSKRLEFGQYIVADPAICHGKLTFKGTRIFVADILEDVERGLSWEFIIHRWGVDKISKAAITEAVHLARRALLNQAGRRSSLSTAA